MKIAILGAGKMGCWFAKQLSQDHEIAIYDLDKSKRAEGTKHLDSISDLLAFNPELLINAVNLQNTIKAFNETITHIPKNCRICDISSIKGELSSFYKKSGFAFGSIHPMFGPTFANMEDLKQQNAIIIKESDPFIKDFFNKVFSKLGIKIFEYSFEDHDKMMAYSLTTPFVASMVFAACVDNTAVPGTTFRKHMETAKGVMSEDNSLLAEVLFNPCSLPQLEKVTAKLEFMKHIIKARDFQEAKKIFDKLRKNLNE